MHTFHNGSVLRVCTAKELVKIPIWNGNRTLDKEHANRIRDAVGSAVTQLDSGYHIITYNEPDTTGTPVRQSYIIDGQHRAHVLREHFLSGMCEPDFPVVVTEKSVESEADAIEYFNAINNVKPQRWRTDPAILANQYIAELERTFNGKTKFIRPNTVRPYLSVEKLRDVLKENITNLAQEPAAIRAFCQRVLAKNQQMLAQSDMLLLSGHKDSRYYERASEVKFMLAVDPKLPWVAELAR
jgi:hypothetical protein